MPKKAKKKVKAAELLAVEDVLSATQIQELAAAADLTEKQLAYFAARGRGMRGPNAILVAGYHCRTRRSATAMAHNLDRLLFDRGLLNSTLLDRGLTMLDYVDGLKTALHSEDARVAFAATKHFGTLLGYGHDVVSDETEEPVDSYDTLEGLKRAVTAELQQRATAAGPDGPRLPPG